MAPNNESSGVPDYMQSIPQNAEQHFSSLAIVLQTIVFIVILLLAAGLWWFRRRMRQRRRRKQDSLADASYLEHAPRESWDFENIFKSMSDRPSDTSSIGEDVEKPHKTESSESRVVVEKPTQLSHEPALSSPPIRQEPVRGAEKNAFTSPHDGPPSPSTSPTKTHAPQRGPKGKYRGIRSRRKLSSAPLEAAGNCSLPTIPEASSSRPSSLLQKEGHVPLSPTPGQSFGLAPYLIPSSPSPRASMFTGSISNSNDNAGDPARAARGLVEKSSDGSDGLEGGSGVPPPRVMYKSRWETIPESSGAMSPKSPLRFSTGAAHITPSPSPS